MRTITVEKSRLLDTVQLNRKKHIVEFKDMFKAYRNEVVGLLEAAILEANAGGEVKRHFHIDEPEDHTEDYNRTLEMIDWIVEDTVDLPVDSFRQYVLNDWSWTEKFNNSKSLYSSRY